MRVAVGVILGAIGSTLVFAACGGGGSTGNANAAGDANLDNVEVGRLVDLFGLKGSNRSQGVELVDKDVLIGPDIQDDRRGGGQKSEPQILFEFIGVDPDTLQPRLLINRQIGSTQFEQARERLDRQVTQISPGFFGQNTKASPFSVAPRNGAIRLTFRKNLGLTEDFFIAKDEQGRVIGIKNPEAVQLLQILKDPTGPDKSGVFRLIPARIAYKGHRIILDPVLLGSEGTAFNVPNNALGLPQSQSIDVANIRIALTLEGPLRIPGLRPDGNQSFLGANLALQQSIIRDFRSGNSKDNSFGISNGFIQDTVPPRVVGEMAMRLERVDTANNRLVVYKAGIQHEIDIGDVVKLFPKGSQGTPAVVSDVILDEAGETPEDQHVFVEVRDLAAFAPHDPSKRPDFPRNAPIEQREAWLKDNAPIFVLATEFSAKSRDDIVNFVNFTPPPQSDKPNQNISPFASLIVRYSKPVDLTTVKPLDTLILATSSSTTTVLDPKLGTPHLLFSQIFDEDGSQTSLRVTPPLGFYLDEVLRNDNKPYYLHIRGGVKGIRDLAGNPLDFQAVNTSEENQAFPFFLDVRKNAGVPVFQDNRVVNIARRFLAQDEDESPAGQQDYFGAVSLFEGHVLGRPTVRATSWVDDRNQLPSPPAPPFKFCSASSTMLLTAATPFGAPVLNPLNPWGCRLQTIWREIDLSLSRTDPFDFNLDIEQMWYAPFRGYANFTFDIFDRITMFVGHSERRPSNCVGITSALPQWPQSGLRRDFWHNYLRSLRPDAKSPLDKERIEERPDEHAAFKDQQFVIRNQDAITEPNGVNRFIKLPEFDKPYLTYRDERLTLLGGGQGNNRVLSPFKRGYWDAFRGTPFQEDGAVGTIGLPLLADFWVLPDDPKLPKDQPWGAIGINGWQISLTVASSALPNFRVYSAGGIKSGQNRSQGKQMDPGKPGWELASGGINPNTGFNTRCCDNNSYWTRVDYLKRISVMTYGFIKLDDPHDTVNNKFSGDPRLGPYDIKNALPRFEVAFEPPLSKLPFGTQLIAEYRSGNGDTSGGPFPNSNQFDPLLAGEAHVRQFSNTTRWWSRYQYTEKLTNYTRDPDKLVDETFLAPFRMKPVDTKVINFRFTFENNVESTPPVTPRLDSFVLLYRLEG